MMYRAGGVAAAMALAVSGGAYAGVRSTAPDVRPLAETQGSLAAIGAAPAGGQENAPAAAMTVEGKPATVTTEVEEVAQEFQVVEQETNTLSAGQTQVATVGTNGVAHVTYQVTTVNGETTRVPVSSVVVTPKVDQVVLVGTGTPEEVALAQAGDGRTPQSAQAVAHVLVQAHGWGEGEFQCLVNLWNRESTWNYQAVNPSSGAYGIAQALPGNKMAETGADWQTNPVTQIKWGLGYISGRYGTPCSAWAHSNAVGWY